MSGYSGNLRIGDDGLVGELRTTMTREEELAGMVGGLEYEVLARKMLVALDDVMKRPRASSPHDAYNEAVWKEARLKLADAETNLPRSSS